jgi:hypothetical protein
MAWWVVVMSTKGSEMSHYLLAITVSPVKNAFTHVRPDGLLDISQ